MTPSTRELLQCCTLCPRACQVDRLRGEKGYCGQDALLRVGRAALHYWEEPCLSGVKGSGAVFFGGCSLRCVYCQNRDLAEGACGISLAGEAGPSAAMHGGEDDAGGEAAAGSAVITEAEAATTVTLEADGTGDEAAPGMMRLGIDRLAEIFLELEGQGANNINLVTPTHFVPQIAEAIRIARREGMNLPVLYNTGGYETVETLRLLDGLVDIYLPDMKYASAKLGAAYSHAPDYFERSRDAIAEMVRQVGEPVFERVEGEPEPMMRRGVIVRHLALPGCGADSRRVLRYLCHTYGNRIYISLMSQYTPMPGVGEINPRLSRRLTRREYDRLVEYALKLGIENAYIQEGDTAEESFIPAFDGQGVWPAADPGQS